MRHKKAFSKLSRTGAHRRAMFRNMATALVLNETVKTTLVKAKELKRVMEKIVSRAKTDTLHARRLAQSYLFAVNRSYSGNAQKLSAVHKLFTEIAPRYKARPGGYTRVVRIPKRLGDRSEMAVIQFVEAEFQPKPKRQRRVRKPEASQAPAAA